MINKYDYKLAAAAAAHLGATRTIGRDQLQRLQKKRRKVEKKKRRREEEKKRRREERI